MSSGGESDTREGGFILPLRGAGAPAAGLHLLYHISYYKYLYIRVPYILYLSYFILTPLLLGILQRSVAPIVS
jgi:hypothetical protein